MSEIVNEVRRRCFRLLKAAAPPHGIGDGEFEIGVLSIYYDGELRWGWRRKGAYSLEVDIADKGEALYEIQHPTEYDDAPVGLMKGSPEIVHQDPELLAQALDILRKHMVLEDLADA